MIDSEGCLIPPCNIIDYVIISSIEFVGYTNKVELIFVPYNSYNKTKFHVSVGADKYNYFCEKMGNVFIFDYFMENIFNKQII